MNRDYVLQSLKNIELNDLKVKQAVGYLTQMMSLDQKERSVSYSKFHSEVTNAGSDSPENYGPLETIFSSEAVVIILPYLMFIVEYNILGMQKYVIEDLYNLADNISYNIKSVHQPYKSRAQRAYDIISLGKNIYERLASGSESITTRYSRFILEVLANPE